MHDDGSELLRDNPGAPTPTRIAREEPHPQLPPWMAYLGSEVSGGHEKLEHLIVMLNSTLDTLEASMTKQAELTKEKMQALGRAMESEAR